MGYQPRGTPWTEVKKKFALLPKRSEGKHVIWFRSYYEWRELEWGPLEFPPITIDKKLFTSKEYIWWALQQ